MPELVPRHPRRGRRRRRGQLPYLGPANAGKPVIIAAVKGTFSGFVKQLNPALGGEHFRKVFGECFPEFENQVGAFGKLDVSTVITSRAIYDVQEGRRRRFAGGPDLPVSRYHAVCSGPTGDDAGSMCYELMTYW